MSAIQRWCSGQTKRKDITRFIKFGLVGGTGVLVGLGSIRLLIGEFHILDILAQACSFILAVTSNFILNEIWTFGDRPKKRGVSTLFKRWLSFLLTSLVGFAVNTAVFMLLKRGFHIHYMWAAVCAIAVAAPVNFLVSNFWVWRLSPQKASIDTDKEP